MTRTTPIRGQFVIQGLHLIYATRIQNLATLALAVPVVIKIENGSCDLDHTPFRGGLSSEIESTCVQTFLSILASAVPGMSLGPQNLQVAQLSPTPARLAA